MLSISGGRRKKSVPRCNDGPTEVTNLLLAAGPEFPALTKAAKCQQ
jgi:hypothetical protein